MQFFHNWSTALQLFEQTKNELDLMFVRENEIENDYIGGTMLENRKKYRLNEDEVSSANRDLRKVLVP